MLKSKRFWLIAGIVLILLAAGSVVVAQRLTGLRQAQAALLQTGQVTSITAVTTVETSGAVQAEQSSSLFWQTTGRVAEVKVKVGDHVQAGDVLMTLDPTSAPQNVILAQADLISAQKALDELLHPSALTIANAQKAVADAQDALTKAQKDLYYAQNPAGQGLHNAVADAQLALETAQANLQLSNVSPDVQGYNSAKLAADQARANLQSAQDKDAECHCISQDFLKALQTAYDNAFGQQLTYELRINTDKSNKADAVAKAQDKYTTAVANLNAALKGPDANKLAVAQAKVAVAQATLADAQSKLDRLSQPDPKDVASAQARVQAAQASVNALTIQAPFDGEVLAVNYQPGDSAAQNQAALVVADQRQLHVDVLVDESDVSSIQAGNPVTVTFVSLSDLALAGRVTQINPMGQTVQGLVKYSVRADLADKDARVLLGMTADVMIVTRVEPNALAVPLDAVQLDQDGEFVNRILAEGRMERVNIVSGETQDDLVVIQGSLQPGDTVQLVAPKPTNNGSPFGPG